MVKTILVPVDTSPHSFAAARLAIQTAKGFGAKILLIHVVEMQPSFAVPYHLMEPDKRTLREIRKSVDGIFAKIERIAKKQNVKVRHEILLRSVSVVESIVIYAKRKKVDLIVTGTKGTGGFRKLLVGSVAQGVFQHAHCSVLVVR